MADVVLPQLGETVTEGTITKWFKKVGDSVAATINGVAVSYTVVAGDITGGDDDATRAIVAARLAAAINAHASLRDFLTAGAVGSVVTVTAMSVHLADY